VTGSAEPSSNVCPTQQISIVIDSLVDEAVRRELRLARWGLVPSWAKAINPSSPLINARSETVTVKPSFRAAAQRRRAIIPARGYYEWTPEPGQKKKTKYYLHPADGTILGFAGLYEWWRPTEAPEDWLCSATIITRPAADSLGHIHDRMPVVVPADLTDDWLSPQITSQVDELLAAMVDPLLTSSMVDA